MPRASCTWWRTSVTTWRVPPLADAPASLPAGHDSIGLPHQLFASTSSPGHSPPNSLVPRNAATRPVRSRTCAAVAMVSSRVRHQLGEALSGRESVSGVGTSSGECRCTVRFARSRPTAGSRRAARHGSPRRWEPAQRQAAERSSANCGVEDGAHTHRHPDRIDGRVRRDHVEECEQVLGEPGSGEVVRGGVLHGGAAATARRSERVALGSSRAGD